MLFRIILSVGTAVQGVSAAIAFAVRGLIAWGLRRASVSALIAAWTATGTKAVMVAAKARAKTDLAIGQPHFQELYDEAGEISVHYWSVSIPVAQRTLQNGYHALSNVRNSVSVNSWWNNLGSIAQQSKADQIAIDHYIRSSNILSVIKTEKTTALNNLLSGIPLALVAFFLTPPSAEAETCSLESPDDFFGLPDTGFFTERVYGWAETNATARLSSSGLWVLDPLQVTEKIGIGDAIANMDQQFYNELLAWKNGLNVGQVLDEIESQGNTTGVNSFQEISNQANAWVDSLNSGQAQPAGKISIQGNTNLSNTILNPSVTFKYLRVDIGNIDKETNVPVITSNSCAEFEPLFACSDAEEILNAPALNCKGFILNYNGEVGVVSFSMGKPVGATYDFLNGPSAPTLSSLLLRFVANGKLMELSEVANYSAMGYLYSNTEQIYGTNSFFITQNGSVQERFLLSVLSDNLLN